MGQKLDTDILPYVKDGSLAVIVKPSSPRNDVLGFDESRKALRVAIAAPAKDSKANVELVKFLSRLLKRKVAIRSGMASKVKMLRIE